MGRGVQFVLSGVLAAAALCVVPVLAQEVDVDESRSIVNRSTQLIGEGKPREALKLLQESDGKISKIDRWLWFGNQGTPYDRLGQYEKALEYFDKAIETEPDCWVYDDRAEIHHLFGRWDQARADLESAKAYYQKRNQPLPRRAAILNVVVNGPFAQDFPKAWRKCETRSKFGHYQVCSNAGIPNELLEALEKKCAKYDPAKPSQLKKIQKLCKPGRQATSVATLMELVRKEYMELVNMKKNEWPEGRIFKVFYFEDAGDFATFNAMMGDPESESTAGYYDPNFHYLALYNRPGGDNIYGFTEDTLNTFFHEGWHQFYHVLAEDPPIWLNEGLAVFMGPSQVLAGGRKIKLGGLKKRSSDPNRISRYENIKEKVRKGTYMKFREFFYVDSDQWHAGNKHNLYAQSWSVCYYALRGNNAAFRRDFLKLFWETAKNRPQKELIDEFFPPEKLDAYEKAWRAFMKKL